MALKDSRDEIGRQIQINTSINNYLCGKTCAALERIKHREKLDSIIRSNLEIYNLPSNFKFTISETSNPENASGLFGTKCYQQTLNGLLEQSGIKIRLQFPDRNRFLMAEMTGTFIISILIILFVVWAFLFLLKQSKQRRIQMERTTAFVNNMLRARAVLTKCKEKGADRGAIKTAEDNLAYWQSMAQAGPFPGEQKKRMDEYSYNFV